MSNYEFIKVENKDNGVSIITLNRPEKKNALNKKLIEELQDAFVTFDRDDSRLVAVLTGAGNTFSAGADLTDMPELWRGIPNVGSQTNKPVIAAVTGWCVGGALVMAMMTDLIVASDTTKFYYPEAKVGFTGGIISGLVNRLPFHAAMEVILLCRTLEADRAYQLGFVNQVVPDGEHVQAAVAMADELATMAPLVHRTLKSFILDEVVKRGPSEQMARTMYKLNQLDRSHDIKEGFAAFREKREPKFLGK